MSSTEGGWGVCVVCIVLRSQHVNVNVNVICLPTEHQGAQRTHSNAFKNTNYFKINSLKIMRM